MLVYIAVIEIRAWSRARSKQIHGAQKTFSKSSTLSGKRERVAHCPTETRDSICLEVDKITNFA